MSIVHWWIFHAVSKKRCRLEIHHSGKIIQEMTFLIFLHIRRVAEKCQTKRRFGRGHSRKWSTWKKHSKERYIIKAKWCYRIWTTQWISSEGMTALVFCNNSKFQFTGQTKIIFYWEWTEICGALIVKSFKNENATCCWKNVLLKFGFRRQNNKIPDEILSSCLWKSRKNTHARLSVLSASTPKFIKNLWT